MRVLSFDIGIKNLAWCLTESYDMPVGDNPRACWKILDWGVWDLRVDIQDEIYHPEFCCGVTKSGNVCGRVPMYADLSGNECLGGYCKTHAKHSKASHTSEDIKKLPRTGVKHLRETAVTLGINPQGMRKKELISAMSDIYRKRCLYTIPKLKNSKRMGLSEIHDRILQRTRDIHCSADLVLIENQPVRMNATMKTIQIILWTSLREKMLQSGVNDPNIRFVNASKKLTVSPKEEFPWCFEIDRAFNPRLREYSQRKKESINRVQTILGLTKQDTHLEWFLHNPKKDDLADCLLMCLWGTCD
jgi:hypothetical protein